MHKTYEIRKVEALERIATALEQIASPAMATQQTGPLPMGTDHIDPNELLRQMQTTNLPEHIVGYVDGY